MAEARPPRAAAGRPGGTGRPDVAAGHAAAVPCRDGRRRPRDTPGAEVAPCGPGRGRPRGPPTIGSDDRCAGPAAAPGRGDLSDPRAPQVLTEIPPGVESGWHTHPGEEVGYILAGTARMMIRGRPELLLHAGDGFLIPPDTPHNAVDVGPDTGRMLSTYLDEEGRPLATVTP